MRTTLRLLAARGEWRSVLYQAGGLNSRDGPFLWQNGQMQWLDELIVPEQQGLWQLYDAFDINDAGQILA